MGATASQFTSFTIVYSTVHSGADQRKHQSSASLVTGEFPAQMASNEEKASIWWRHRGLTRYILNKLSIRPTKFHKAVIKHLVIIPLPISKYKICGRCGICLRCLHIYIYIYIVTENKKAWIYWCYIHAYKHRKLNLISKFWNNNGTCMFQNALRRSWLTKITSKLSYMCSICFQCLCWIMFLTTKN